MSTPHDAVEPLHALVVAAHPDDAEAWIGGTILTLTRAGRRVGVLDCTRGEMGTRGDATTRAAECERASAILGLAWRGNLERPDARLLDDDALRDDLARWICRLRPAVLFSPHPRDRHPDHAAAGQAARAAWQRAGLARWAAGEGLAAHRPPRRFETMGHQPFEPSLVVDTTLVHERKLDALRAYASQHTPRDASDDGRHQLAPGGLLDRVDVRDRWFGGLIGARTGEPLFHDGPLPADASRFG